MKLIHSLKIQGDKLKTEQLSFLKPVKRPKEKHKEYDATICYYYCLCRMCKYSVELDICAYDEKEKKTIGDEACFNCDNCFYYGLNENLSKNIFKFHCDKFEMSKYYVELYAQDRRKKFKVIRKIKEASYENMP